MINKNILRQQMLQKRENMPREIVKSSSDSIIDKILNLREYKESKTIMCYVDFRNEVATSNLIRECLASGKRAAVPYVLNKYKKEMTASEIFNLETELISGTFGVMEPKEEFIRIIDPLIIDLVIIPGVAFDHSRNRLGFGAGYYDRFLKQLRPDCVKIGICHDVQIYSQIPVDAFDIPMDVVITEARVI